MTVVHVIVPDSIDDPNRPSGGNVYDRRICSGLATHGWSVHEHALPGAWPRPDGAAVAALADVVAGIPDRAVTLIDGLMASTAPEVLLPEARRLRLVVLVHMPLGDGPAADPDVIDRERTVLSAAAAVVTTSNWTRHRLIDRYALLASRVHVAAPGVDIGRLAPGTVTGGELLCVAAVTPEKGHEVLLAALTTIRDIPWRCLLVGALTVDRGLVDELRHQSRNDGISDRICLAGPQDREYLDVAYTSADVLVLASRAETYAMVVTEALARGLPVIATAVGGLPEALGHAADGQRPGLLVPADDPAALAGALSRWLTDAGLRRHLRGAARDRRTTLSSWSVTTRELGTVLTGVTA